MRSVVLLTLFITAVSSRTEQCEMYRKKADACYKYVLHQAGLSTTSERLKTKHLVCCYTHVLLDCFEEAATETSCQLDVREEATKDHLMKYMRLRCDKYNECNRGDGLSYSYFALIMTFVVTLSSLNGVDVSL